MPDSFVTLLRMPNRSRPQRTKSAASKTGSYSFTTKGIGLPAAARNPVSRAARAEALRLPVRRLVGDGEVRHRRPAHGDAFRLEDVDELVQLALCRAHDKLGIRKPGDQLIDPRQPLGDVEGDREGFGRDHRALEAPDNDLLERVPFVVGTNR